jgi:hypothetical protein
MYKVGAENSVADELYRRCHDNTQSYALSTVVPHWLDEVVAGYSRDQVASELVASLTISPEVVPNFTLQNGLLRFKKKVWIPNVPAL